MVSPLDGAPPRSHGAAPNVPLSVIVMFFPVPHAAPDMMIGASSVDPPGVQPDTQALAAFDQYEAACANRKGTERPGVSSHSSAISCAGAPEVFQPKGESGRASV